MARKALIEKSRKPQRFKVRAYSRCNRCGRPRAVMAETADLASEIDLERAQDARREAERALETGYHEGADLSSARAALQQALTRIRIANKALQETVEMPSSRLKAEIARLLKEEGYIRDFHVARQESLPYDTLTVELKFGRNRERVITDLKRVSKPGRRVYARKDRLPRVLGGMGISILSTSNGLITSRTAEERGVGGEVICFVW